jgi:putative SOS response-associated peptidase YedK
VLVPADRYDDWLDPGLQDLEQIAKLIGSMPEPHLQPCEVAKAVGNIRNNGPQLVEPVG